MFAPQFKLVKKRVPLESENSGRTRFLVNLDYFSRQDPIVDVCLVQLQQIQ